jgi:fructose-specific phosphotransferase system IIC component
VTPPLSAYRAALPEPLSALLRASLGVLALPFLPRVLGALIFDSVQLAERMAFAPFMLAGWL